MNRCRSDGFIADFCDGTLFKMHSLFGQNPHALQIIAYFDELEVCNPLGGQAGIHKLGKFLIDSSHVVLLYKFMKVIIYMYIY